MFNPNTLKQLKDSTHYKPPSLIATDKDVEVLRSELLENYRRDGEYELSNRSALSNIGQRDSNFMVQKEDHIPNLKNFLDKKSLSEEDVKRIDPSYTWFRNQ